MGVICFGVRLSDLKTGALPAFEERCTGVRVFATCLGLMQYESGSKTLLVHRADAATVDTPQGLLQLDTIFEVRRSWDHPLTRPCATVPLELVVTGIMLDCGLHALWPIEACDS